MRAVDCPCGEHLEARNDSELVQAATSHASDAHGDEYSEADIRLLVNTTAYDMGADRAS